MNIYHKDGNRGLVGPTKLSAPTQPAKALLGFQKSCTRLYCVHCRAVQDISDVLAVRNDPHSFTCNCLLHCGHRRSLTVGIKRAANLPKKVKQTDEDLTESDLEEREVAEIHADMAAEGVL